MHNYFSIINHIIKIKFQFKMSSNETIYKDFRTKSILVWVCIVLMCVGWILTIRQAKNKNLLNKGINMISDKVSNTIMNKDTSQTQETSQTFEHLFNKYGGYAIFLGSWLALCIIEARWKPYKILKGVNCE